jgi:hypothetical protein
VGHSSAWAAASSLDPRAPAASKELSLVGQHTLYCQASQHNYPGCAISKDIKQDLARCYIRPTESIFDTIADSGNKNLDLGEEYLNTLSISDFRSICYRTMPQRLSLEWCVALKWPDPEWLELGLLIAEPGLVGLS